ncbi:hypothetical protein F8388_004584 [Cannabis sativa]|uniref:Uncharacterized protein n=1 Tax=Cannabis sativa TaxID=3483 RepID=A0A7J6GNC7_CANSA|nr:hypothetical protein F8388_004584 [Cannabis sativa]
MPKERRDRSVSRDRCRFSPFPCSSSNRRRSPKISSDSEENVKEWEEARCPVCMEHPHNAVLLICSSHDKGCRPYMCDTSYRHSNCLDQFRKSFAADTPSTVSQQEENQVITEETELQEEETQLSTTDTVREEEEEEEEEETQLLNTNLSSDQTLESTVTVVQEEITVEGSLTCEHQIPPKIVCPLCRGQVKEWTVVDSARRFMNAKSRSCSSETCSFTGTYTDLRKHARLEHPQVRPSDADPERQRNWRRLERQRDLGDLLSTLQSSMGDERSGDESILPIDDGGWLTVFFLIRVFRPGSSSRSSSWSGSSRTRAQLSIRRRSTRLWGDNYEEDTGSSSREEDNNESSDDGSGPWTRRDRAEIERILKGFEYVLLSVEQCVELWICIKRLSLHLHCNY